MSGPPDENRPFEPSEIVIATELHALSDEPKVAKLILHTLEGSQRFGITDDIAEGLIDMLQQFLRRKPP